MLIGQRRVEIAGMASGELNLDGGFWIILREIQRLLPGHASTRLCEIVGLWSGFSAEMSGHS
jgi:hypothetical protein